MSVEGSDLPPPGAGDPSSPALPPPGRGLGAAQVRPITVPVLVSALANLVAGYLWLFLGAFCIGVFITAPMLVLCAFELIFFARAPQMAPADVDRRGTVLGVFEIILGIFNGVSFVCGIVVLLNVMKLRERLATGV